jgi:hypothetical protein
MKSRLLVPVVAGLMLAAPALAQESIGSVKRAVGEVRIERDGAQLPPSRGMEVKRGDHVVTGPDGYIQVALRDTASVGIGPDSSVPLDRFAPTLPAQPQQPGLLQRLTSLLTLSRHPN